MNHSASDLNDAIGTPMGAERRNDASRQLDEMSTLDVLALMNREDQFAAKSVGGALPDVARLVEIASAAVRAGGTVHYFGAGTSGRLAALDAAELLPTFNLPPGVVVAHIAGGERALVRAVENSEDSWDEGAREAATLGPNDVAIGLTASGHTPYVGGALERAGKNGARTALIACNAQPALAELAELLIVVDTGPEVLTGSTRLKAGTAEKLILNGFSTALMVSLGRTWSNLMVSVVATNDKLRKRTVRILMDALDIREDEARERLAEVDGELKIALVTALADVTPEAARTALADAADSVRGSLALLAATPSPCLSGRAETRVVARDPSRARRDRPDDHDVDDPDDGARS